MSRRSAKFAVVSEKVQLNGLRETNHLKGISIFDRIEWNGEVLQTALPRLYLMLNKPRGYLSATTDPDHPTVLDLIDVPGRETLHLAGRLDRSSTGLILLTNDSQWSEKLSHPDYCVAKTYLVETSDPIPEEAVRRFEQGFRFACEGIVTKPAKLEILASHRARVTITEGKYHQVKRMFHRINQNRLVSLHRERVGQYRLPDDLNPGEWCEVPGRSPGN